MVFKAFMFVLNSAVPFVLNWYYKRVPMFYLPPGDWFGPLERVLCFPNAPPGAVSSTVWHVFFLLTSRTTVCGRVLALLGAYCRELFVREPPAPRTVPMTSTAEKTASGKAM